MKHSLCGTALALALLLAPGAGAGAPPAGGEDVGSAEAAAPAPSIEASAPSEGGDTPPVSLAPPIAAAADPAAAPAGEARTLRQWYALGGWVMHFLAAVSVLVAALVLERAFALRGSAVLPGGLASGLRDAFARARPDEARRLCRESRSSLARITRAGLAAGPDRAAALEAVRGAGETELALLRRNLGLLAALGNLATMLGLLGTVLGMIEAFDVIARVGTGDARVVASGIFRALVTTAGGLGIGIVALGAHALLRRRIEGLALRLEETVGALFASGDEAAPARADAGAPDPVPAS